MLQRKPMKSLFVLALIIFGFSAHANKLSKDKVTAIPIANAGGEQTIYLSQTSTVTLNGSASSGDSYQWTDVSTDYKSGANITSPQSPVTTVTGLNQGVWYFQLEVTSGGVTAKDVVVIKVNYDLPPSGTLIHSFNLSDPAALSVINIRSDTTNFYPVNNWTYGQFSDTNTPSWDWEVFRDRSNGMYIDGQRGKMISTIQDGYEGTDGYPRAEISTAGYNFTIDTLKTYVFEWKGYFPQNYNYLTSWYQILTMFQIHSGTQTPTVFGYDLDASGNLILGDVYDDYSGTNYGKGTGLKTVTQNFSTLNNFYNNTHTIRVTVREGRGYNGQTAFIKAELDGVVMYNRTTGQVGSSSWDDYVKFGGLYDWNSAMVSGSSLSRGRIFQLVTEGFNVYVLGNNQPPKANAGANQTITLPTSNITLSGSGTDPDGTISSYQWTQLSGPFSGTIKNSNSASTTVSGLIQGGYQFQLKVTDNQGATATSTTLVTVNIAQTVNKVPVANAGADQTVTLPTNTIQLSGSGNDTDGTIISFLWTEITGPAAIIKSSSLAATAITELTKGTYEFELAVKDDKGDVGKDTVKITVNAASAPNIAPVASAGSDQIIILPNNTISLTGSGKDPDGTISSYLWTKVSGPASVRIKNSSSPITPVRSLVEGIYLFELTVTDDKGAMGKDTVKITVNAASALNVAPTAIAGTDQTKNLPVNSVSLSGSGKDIDGSISSYLWSKISGPAATITNISSAATTVTGLAQGTYEFELTVTDDKGAVGKDTIKVIVNAAVIANVAPIANAGADQTITLPTNTIQLLGNGSDADGSISSYEWTKMAGPSTFSIVNSSSALLTINNLVEGVYKFQFNVTDDKGASAKDTVMVTVNAATILANVAPTVNAGSDQSITLPTNSITVSGNGADSDGSISSYQWTKISGSSSYTIVNPLSSASVISGLQEGIYQFQLKVTDDKGSIATDTLQITVNASTNATINQAPVADAGSDVTIVSSSSSVTLYGSGTDKDGKVTAYSWKQLSGPSTSDIVQTTTATPTISNLTGGNYQFELTVTDNNGAIGQDTVNVTVALERLDPRAQTRKLNIYPNPVHTIANLELTAPYSNTNVAIVITDMNGSQVYKREFVSNSIQVSQQIDMSNLTKGVYVVSVFFDGMEMQSMKVVKL
jgi:hypothetical protein